MEPSTYIPIKPKLEKKFDVDPLQDLQPESVILTEDFSRLVRAISQELPFDHAGDRSKSLDHTHQWGKSVEWASSAWKTVYIALVARKSVAFRREHPIALHPAREFVTTLAQRHFKDPKEAIQWLKFQTTYLFAKATQQNELPAGTLQQGIPGILAGGWVYRRCRQLMSGRSFGGALDILLSKYGMPKAPQSFVDSTLQQHSKALLTSMSGKTIADCVSSEDYDGLNRCLETKVHLDSIKEKIQEVVHRIFCKPFSDSHVFPKPSACFERNTQRGGQMRELVESFFKECCFDDFYGEGLHGAGELFLISEVAPGVVRSCYVEPFGDYLVKRFEQFVDKCCDLRSGVGLDAKQFGILEPLKCRVILMARAAEMLRVTSVQKWMHSSLKKCPAFRYIGEPDSLEDISGTFFPVPGWKYISGDYSAATDNINAELSEFAWDCIASRGGIVGELYHLGKKCLTGHILYDPEGTLLGDQKNGQSMGSPMSFPILCVINAACWLAAYERPVNHLYIGPIRVNGDDIVFAGREDRYDHWWEVNGAAGLFPSRGKNYISDHFLIINSHAYTLKEGVWSYKKAVNVALAQDLVRKGIYAGSRTGAPWFLQKANFDHLTKGHKSSTAQFLRGCFLEHVRVPPGVSPHLGVLAGGPGFLLDGEEPSVLSRAQTALFLCTKNHFFEQIPRPKDDSYEGTLLQTVIRDHTVRTKVLAGVEDPLLDPGWRRSRDSVLDGGNLLASLLLAYDIEDVGKSAAAKYRDPIMFPQRDILEGQGIFFDPRYRSQVRRYEARLSAFYSGKRFEKCFPRVTGGRYCTLQPCDVGTVQRLCKNFRIHSETFGLSGLSSRVLAYQYH